ncbi:MAG: Na/Pi cotransporter family protein [Eubacteriales bacterium]|nr:Na/Pi cotransporter family protein [Eubacteriales bacterium]
MNNIVFSILTLLAGCGVFIAGMNMMSDGLERSAGGGMKKLLGKLSNNRFAGVGVGVAVTAIIQSSSATSVMVIGFVNAGIMTLMQATAIIMGANIGTTVTGLIVSLSAFDVSLYASVLAFIGVMMTFIKKEKVKIIGSTLCGLGLLFVGLDAMSGAFNNAEIKNFFEDLLASINFPLLLILVGALFTALIQSSSAATGLIIIMVGQGVIPVENALFIVLGSNIGTCITAILASIGASTNAKRTAFIHLMFNVIGTIIFTIILWIFTKPIVNALAGISNTQMQIAWFHVIFNVTTTILLLPFIKYLVKFATFVIKDKKVKAKDKDAPKLKFIDELLLSTPAIALMQVQKEIEYMASLSKQNLEKSYVVLTSQDDSKKDEILKTEENIDFSNNAITKYLIKLSPNLEASDETRVAGFFHVINDVERLGDHAENFYEIGAQMKEAGLQFSETAQNEIKNMVEKTTEMFDIALNVFTTRNTTKLARLTELEKKVDLMKKDYTASHFNRLATGDCQVEVGAYFFSTISGLERIADHLINVGYSVLNPTGSQKIEPKIETL